jgi:sphinganine-1-phosphate aldolase
MSADMHKYGYGSKGASVIVYRYSRKVTLIDQGRSDEYRKYQYFSHAGFPGGLYSSPTMCGTRGGGPFAAAWYYPI